MRILSLIPSGTEIVYSLGFQNWLVGRTHGCDFPDGISNLPICTKPRNNASRDKGINEDAVDEVLRLNLSAYTVKVDLIKELRPDVVITQLRGGINAQDMEVVIEQFAGYRPNIVSMNPYNLSDIWSDIANVGNVLGGISSAKQLIASFNARISAVREVSTHLLNKPSVACIGWISPLIAAAFWMPELVNFAGGENIFGVSGEHSPKITWEQLRESDPDAIILLPCGFDLQRTMIKTGSLTKQPGWERLSAVKMGRIYTTAGDQYFNRPGPD